MELDDILGRLRQLAVTLRTYSDGDREQEVTGIAVPVLDEVLAQARRMLDDGDPVLERIHDVISAEGVAAGQPIRAIDALLVTEQLLAALEHQWSERERAKGPITMMPEPGPFDQY